MVGLETSDDAAVYKVSEERAIIETLDFFTPIVDDPYTFGQIAAANSLSDVYAMGGEPILAMNISCFPNCLSPNILKLILKGGFDKVKEAGALLIGGHTVQDDELKYGMSVTGFVHPDKVLRNTGVKDGDVLILTKPLGLGIINTAVKGGICDKDSLDEAVLVMKTLNKKAKDAMDGLDVHACTDITGFGLMGHVYEMLRNTDVTVEIYTEKLPVLKGALDYAMMGLVPAGAYDNRVFVGDNFRIDGKIKREMEDLLFDPQTSGGLLISLSEEDAKTYMKRIDLPFGVNIIAKAKKFDDKYILIK